MINIIRTLHRSSIFLMYIMLLYYCHKFVFICLCHHWSMFQGVGHLLPSLTLENDCPMMWFVVIKI